MAMELFQWEFCKTDGRFQCELQRKSKVKRVDCALPSLAAGNVHRSWFNFPAFFLFFPHSRGDAIFPGGRGRPDQSAHCHEGLSKVANLATDEPPTRATDGGIDPAPLPTAG